MRQLPVLLFLLFAYSACLKTSSPPKIAGRWDWTVQYFDNPNLAATPQSSGIQETLIFTNDGQYNLARNGLVADDGHYQLFLAKSANGQYVSGIRYSNTRISDSVSYYVLADNNDSLFFSYDLIGTVGSGARHYGRP